MADERTRRADRGNDFGRALAERMRAGLITQDRMRLARVLGCAPAAAALGAQASQEVNPKALPVHLTLVNSLGGLEAYLRCMIAIARHALTGVGLVSRTEQAKIQLVKAMGPGQWTVHPSKPEVVFVAPDVFARLQHPSAGQEVLSVAIATRIRSPCEWGIVAAAERFLCDHQGNKECLSRAYSTWLESQSDATHAAALDAWDQWCSYACVLARYIEVGATKAPKVIGGGDWTHGLLKLGENSHGNERGRLFHEVIEWTLGLQDQMLVRGAMGHAAEIAARAELDRRRKVREASRIFRPPPGISSRGGIIRNLSL